MEVIWFFIAIVVFAILFGGEGPKKPGKYDHIHKSTNANDRMLGAS